MRYAAQVEDPLSTSIMTLHHAMIASPLTWPALFPDPTDYTGTLQ